jgi:hypothetical protein
VSERLVADMRQMEKELSAAHAAAEAQLNRMQAEAAVEREKSEAALKESEQRCIHPLIIKPGRTHDLISCRAIADIERLQSQFAADRAQQQQQQQQIQSRMQADIDALRAAVALTETHRDAAIGRASLMKEQVIGLRGCWVIGWTDARQALTSHDYVRRVVEAVAPVLQQGEKSSAISSRVVPAIDDELVGR